MAAKKTSYRALRTETITLGEKSYVLVAGETYTDLPQELVDGLSGGYGGLEEVADE